MTLADISLETSNVAIPQDIASFLERAEQVVKKAANRTSSSFRGFVPSDYVTVFQALSVIAKDNLAPGRCFCEWGSGVGVVASLAGLLGYDAIGIEIDRDLFDESCELAAEYDVPVEFIHGSFVPRGAESLLDSAYRENDGSLALEAHADDAYDQLGLEVRDFDVVFAYPWPNDEEVTAEIFDRFASRGALLLTYAESETGSVRLRRKR